MDETTEAIVNDIPWPLEEITIDCELYRHVHYSHRPKYQGKRRHPNESHFILKDGEDGLSFNWNKYAKEKRGLIVIGLKIGNNGSFIPISDYSYFKFPVSFLYSIVGVYEIVHNPIFNGDPSEVGSPNNKSHSLVVFDRDDLSVRVNLSDYCNEHYESAKCDTDLAEIASRLNELRDRLNNTPYHKLWVFENESVDM